MVVSRRVGTALVVAAGLAAGAAIVLVSRGDAAGEAVPSYTRTVAPVLAEKCAGCHRLGGIAPFRLDTATAARKYAALVAAAVSARTMPPWPPGPASPPYVGQDARILSGAQRAAILAWARAGGPIDGPATPPPAVTAPPARQGETTLTLPLGAAYTPRAQNGATDDYRCFLLDPGLAQDGFVTSARIVPGAPKIVHHVILFRVEPAQVAQAERLDRGAAGLGWPCFGGTGIAVAGANELNDAPWVSAWAPGWGGGRLPEGTGVPLRAGSRIVMQVHYNLLNGRAPDRSRAVLTVAPAATGLKSLQTILLPAPVELACAKGETGRLCNRDEAIGDLARKYGQAAAYAPVWLLVLCRGDAVHVRPSATTTCDRRIDRPSTIYVAAGHMHLLGASIRVELNPGTARRRVLLDIPRWDFHWQNAYQLAQPVAAGPGDVLRVTCRHDVTKRHHTEGVPHTPRYILWGEGTTDEMCLGIAQVTRG
jgi:Copper type II ascorbate-dependent monooxygenase, C-terminal domain